MGNFHCTTGLTMGQIRKVRVTIKGHKGAIYLYGREALRLLVWWDMKPPHTEANTKVEFYRGKAGTEGSTFSILSAGQRGGYKRSELTLNYP
jgi:hypothetical protein